MGKTKSNSKVVSLRMYTSEIEAIAKMANGGGVSGWIEGLVQRELAGVDVNTIQIHPAVALKDWIEARAKEKGFTSAGAYIESTLEKAANK